MNASCGMLTLPPAFAGAGRLRRSRIRALPLFYFAGMRDPRLRGPRPAAYILAP